MKQYIKRHIYEFVLLGIVILLAIVNYRKGTYLSGWDNLQTEIAPWLGVERAFFSVWEEYQSFGLLAGMAHATDLPRAVLIWLLSFILPQNLIRYCFQFMMLIIGGLGMMKLINTIGRESKKTVFGFMGALFYILNLGTMQLFGVPYEAFTIFFAALPWLCWSYLHINTVKTKRSDWFIFFFIQVIASAAFYVQTLFVVYLIIIVCLLFTTINKSNWKKVFLIGGVIITVNSYWLAPQIYFIKTSLSTVREAKINQFSDTTNNQNREKGLLSNFLKMEGYYMDLNNMNHAPLFLPWKNHFAKPVIGLIPYFFSFIAIIGICNIRKKHYWSFLAIFFVVIIALLNATPPFSWIYDILLLNKTISQIFRSSFTKFIIPYAMVASFFFASGLELISKKINSKIVAVVFVLLLGIYALPAFQGNLISSEMKVKIPNDYFELISYMRTVDKNKRIALLPDYTFWGWFLTKWGYNGSGFIWYGIEQPIVSRTFDVWSEKSESYFWEIKAAIENEDMDRFNNVLEKYQIDYLLVDNSLLPVVGSIKSMQYDTIKKLLDQNRTINLVKKWHNIALYQIIHKSAPQNFIFAAPFTLLNIGPAVTLTDNDSAFQQYGNYYTSPNEIRYYFPYLDFTSQTQLLRKKWALTENSSQFIINTDLDFPTANYTLFNPISEYSAWLYNNNQLIQYKTQLNSTLSNKKLITIIDKTLISKLDIKDAEVSNCRSLTTCYEFNLPYLQQRYGYIFKIKNKNIAGRRMYFYITDNTRKQILIEDRLREDTAYYFLPPKYQYGLGYSIVFENESSVIEQSENQLETIETYIFPATEIKQIKMSNNIPNTILSEQINFTSKKRNYFTYEVQLNNKATVILYQSFHPGWVAYNVPTNNWMNQNLAFLFGQKINTHVLINNWANGWLIEPETKNIVIIFWPQYLQYLGLGLLLISFFGIVFWKSKKNKSQS